MLTKKHNYILCIFLYLLVTTSHAQNLVKNPGFENIKSCPYYGHNLNWYAHDWWGFDTTDTGLFNTCGSSGLGGSPFTDLGIRYPKTGNGFASIMICPQGSDINARSYAQGFFINPLFKDSVYCISYWVSRATLVSDKTNRASKNVDAFINDTILNWNNGIGRCLLNFTPQIKCNYFLTDTINWMQVSGLYKAHGGEMHITIGNFNNYATTQFTSTASGYPRRVDYFLDDVSVTPFTLQKPNLGKDTVLCRQVYPYILTAPLGYDSILWSNGAVNTTTLNITQPGKYWVRCVANGCGSLTDTIVIKTQPLPKLKLRNDTALCKGKPLTITTNTGFLNYNWNTGATTASITVKYTGNYILTVQDACGLQKDTVHITYDSLPNLILNIGIDTNICRHETDVPLTITTQYNGLPNYNWSNGANTPNITISTGGQYWLTVNYKCGTLNSNTITVTDCPPDTSLSIWIPNSFTPNLDGTNDVWKPVYINQDITELYIYNRWGQKIFSGNLNNNYAWDGMYNNQPCEQGVYAYIITYKSAPPTKKTGEIQKTGVISLVR